ncbi:hypothetical protein X777_13675, partial [Ooceraea biroi]
PQDRDRERFDPLPGQEYVARLVRGTLLVVPLKLCHGLSLDDMALVPPLRSSRRRNPAVLIVLTSVRYTMTQLLKHV